MDQPFHPIANRYPLMAQAELAELAEDIKARGLRHRITSIDGLILDGRNRWHACRMAGLDPNDFTDEYQGDTDPESLVAFVESANEHRRHLSEEQRRRYREQRAARLRANGASLRSIADELGVSAEQVRVDLQVSSDLTPETVTGKDNKTYPAQKPKRKKPQEQPDAPEDVQRHPPDEDDPGPELLFEQPEPEVPEQPSPADALKDDGGLVVPAWVVPAWERRRDLRALVKQLGQLYKDTDALQALPYGYDLGPAMIYMEDVRRELKAAAPSRICPACDAATNDCEKCHGYGWLTADLFEQVKLEVEAEAALGGSDDEQ